MGTRKLIKVISVLRYLKPRVRIAIQGKQILQVSKHYDAISCLGISPTHGHCNHLNHQSIQIINTFNFVMQALKRFINYYLFSFS